MKQIILIIIIFLVWLNGFSQSIIGSLSMLPNQSISLEGFNGLKTYLISTTTIDEKGNFKLIYTKADYGVGYLMAANEKPMFVMLSGEDIEIVGEVLSYPENLKTLKGKENQIFSQYAKEHPRREQTLSAWRYLNNIYNLDTLFSKDKKTKKFITEQCNKIKQDDQDFLSRLDPKTYVSWYLPVRRLISDVSIIAQYHPEEIPATIKAFRKLDYSDERLYHSGLMHDAIDSHFWLLENSGKPIDSVYIEMKISIDSMMTKLCKDDKKLNEITNYLFDLLERHSLFQASEYLALKVLNEVSCTIDKNLAKQLESYRAMKKGNIAPDFSFYSNTVFPNDIPRTITTKLSDLKTPYTLILFGSSACPKCVDEIPQIAELYAKWKSQGVEVVFISLDESEKDFQQFVSSFPFISSCDFKKWNSQIIESYYVFATPTMFLLNNKREILLRPNSIKQMDAWVDWFLIKKQ